jgi:hypothetical protein
MLVKKVPLSKTRNPLLPDTMLSQGAYDEILKVDPMYFGLENAKGVEQQRQNIKKNIPLGLSTAEPTPMAQTPMSRSMPMNMPSMEEPEQDSTNFLGSLLAQGVASLGAGIQGGDIAQVGRSFEAGRQRAEQDRKAKALVDPKSEESKRRRMVFEKALGSSIPEEYSATDLNDPVVLQSIRDKKMQEMAPKSGVRGGIGQAKLEKESKEDIKNIQSFKEATVENQKFLKQLDDYSKIVKEIPITGGTTASGASKIAAAQSLRGKLLFSLKNIEKTGALDQGMINIADGILGSPDYTRNEVVDARTNQLKQTIQDEIQASASKYGIIGTAQGEDGKLYYVDKNNNPVMQVK